MENILQGNLCAHNVTHVPNYHVLSHLYDFVRRLVQYKGPEKQLRNICLDRLIVRLRNRSFVFTKLQHWSF